MAQRRARAVTFGSNASKTVCESAGAADGIPDADLVMLFALSLVADRVWAGPTRPSEVSVDEAHARYECSPIPL